MQKNNLSPEQSVLSRGYLIALLSAFILSSSAILIRLLTGDFSLPPLVLAFWRDGFVAFSLFLILLVFSPSRLRVNRSDLLYLLAYGFLLSVFNSLWTFSVSRVGAAVGTILIYSSAGFTVLLGWWLLKESLNWGKVIAVVLSLGGCVLVSGLLDMQSLKFDLAGVLTGILSGILYAGYSLMGRSASQRGINAWTTILYTFGFAAMFLMLLNLFSGGRINGTAGGFSEFFLSGLPLIGWGWLLLLALLPTLAGFGLYNVSLGYLPSGIANLIATTEPVFTAVMAFFLFGERLDGIQLLGSFLILSGVIYLRLYEERRQKRLQPALEGQTG